MKTSKEESEKLRPMASASTQEEVSILLKDPLIKKKMDELHVDASFLMANLPLFLAYQESIGACSRCKGKAFCSSLTPYHSMDLFIDDGGILNRTYGRCHFLAEEEAVRSGYLYRDFDESSLSLDLKSGSKRSNDLIKCCVRAIDGSLHPWVFVYGGNGVGKSTILIAICNRLIKKSGKRVAFLDCNKRFDEFKALAIKDKKAFEDKMNQIAAIEILVLDDFGNEYKSDYTRDQILMPLLNYRAKKNLVTYFLSNYTLDEIKTLYSNNRAGAIIANRLVNLIGEKIDTPYELKPGFETSLSSHK